MMKMFKDCPKKHEYRYVRLKKTLLAPCSACGVPTDDVELSQDHRLCSECYRNYEQ
jgi:hypothetical protein